MKEFLCETQDLAIGYGKTPLASGIALRAKPGQILVLVGPNGAGKSTLGYALMGHPKYHITGGIGATSNGEAFGKNYELPNMSAYCETCAAIGNVYVNYRRSSSRLFVLPRDSIGLSWRSLGSSSTAS